jgi:hypothetical protein
VAFDEPADSAVHQLVCSPVHHAAPWFMKVAFRVAWLRPVARLVRALARHSGVRDPSVRWKHVAGPIFGNALATLVLEGRRATFTVERAVPAGRGSRFGPVCSIELDGAPIG